ncbi:MAG: endonuclease MutS2 [Suipraeoptans sp.]
MNNKAMEKLEYFKIIGLLTEKASSKGGKLLCRNLIPMTDIDAINRAQEETACAFNRIVKRGNLSFYGLNPVEPSLKHLAIGGILSSSELLNILNLLRVCAKTKSYGRGKNDEESIDILDAYFDVLSPLNTLTTEIGRCIISEDEISDEASTGLKQIRREINKINEKVHGTLHHLVNKSYKTYLQDPIITMRGDRYCIPVKAEYKNQVPGMIHDQSSSGSTLFIEPMAVVNLNNELQTLHGKEKEEIQKILAELSVLAAENIDEIRINETTITTLDFIFAKGSLALDENASKPLFNREGSLYIRQGRHPLLNTKTVVPITVTLGESFDLLVITGPNTGGKTVTLKTIGLFSLMGQAGLHIPALDRSKLPVFNDIFADIGDEQSIEQSLSTFSSHMTNIVSFIKNVDSNSLVLFDELGAGTDPVEGAALAMSILDYLHSRQIRTVATTHYSELKTYALTTPGVENASCEFDVATLRPTYRLLLGIPGKSNAFAIAGKLGLPDYIIDSAKTHISEKDESFEDVLNDLETKRKLLESEKMKVEDSRIQIDKLKAQLQSKEQNLSEKRDKILNSAKEEASQMLREAKETADETIKNIRKYGENISLADMEKERARLREKINTVDTGAGITLKAPTKKYKPSDFKLGEKVRVLSMNLTGNIVSLPDKKGKVTVQMGIMKSVLPITDLEIIDEEPLYEKKYKEQSKKGSMNMGKAMQISPEINLLGKTVDEAIALLDKYLDDAYLSHLTSVRVVHGKGTGALRNGIHSFLKRQKNIKSYRLGEFGEGDAGVTIVEFK